MGTRLFVGNLSYNTNELDLRAAFEEGGRTVVEAKIVTDRETGRSRGFAFVEMGSAEEASAVTNELNGRELDGRAINVSEARERAPRSGGSWAGGGGGGYGGGGGGYGGDGGGGRDRGGRGGRDGGRDSYENRGRRGGW
jgi:RNA recognition motif-containing protein